jgi:hypothetical protein
MELAGWIVGGVVGGHMLREGGGSRGVGVAEVHCISNVG